MYMILLFLFLLCIPTTSINRPKNKKFTNVHVLNQLCARDICALHDSFVGGNINVSGDAKVDGLTVGENASIGGGLYVSNNTTINGDLVVTGTIDSPALVRTDGSSTVDAVARFANSSGTLIKNSPVLVDDSGNIEIYGITKNANTVSWPSTIGSAGTFLESDGAGNLIYGSPAGAGNVTTANSFVSDNAIVVTDLPNGAENVKETTVSIDSFNNITGINTLTASTVNAPTLNGNATSATNFTNPLNGDVVGNQTVTQVVQVGDRSAGEIASATDAANTATHTNESNTIVKRDASGNFSAETITANLIGNVTGDLSGNASSATTAGTATNFSGALAGDVIGNQTATQVITVGERSAADIALATDAANTATHTNVPNTIVKRDASGNFSAETITANLMGNVTGSITGTADAARYFIEHLDGDVSGAQDATVVDTVGGRTAIQIRDATDAANAATDTLTKDKIVKRDNISGGFLAGTITATLIGDVTGNLFGNADTATNATTAVNFSGALTGNVTGNQGSTQVISVGGQSAANIASATVAANAATSDLTGGTIVRRDGSGNFSAGTITASLTGTVSGNVTGNLTGNADTATYATTAGTATNFSGALNGDVIGYQTTTTVMYVGGETAADVASATRDVIEATPNNEANQIVKRDGSGDFRTNKITIDGTIINPNDAVTKEYVDSVVSAGCVAKEPALVVGLNDVTLSGTQTIDGVDLSVDDRVLLVGQTDPIENGLWLTQVNTWTRPNDFAPGDTAGQAYVLTTSGATKAGTGWLCNTLTAIIGTDSIVFVQFTAPGQTTAANVGSGVGKIFRDKTGITINLKTLAAYAHMTIANNANDITIGTDATTGDPGTIVARDGSGNFTAGIITANLTGEASENVRKSGDIMTGNLNMATQSEVRYQDAAGGEYIGLRAPATVGSSYTIDLPPNPPVAGQYLKAVTSSSTTWTVVDAPPAATKTYYVTLVGNDSDDGSLSAPFRTIRHAVNEANLVATLNNPVTIDVGAGMFFEDNSGGPITLNADGIAIKGSTQSSSDIIPTSTSTNLFNITVANVELTNLTLYANPGGSSASAINVTTEPLGSTLFKELNIYSFQTGISASSLSGDPVIVLKNCILADNATCVAYTKVRSLIQGNLFRGQLSNVPANTGIYVTGDGAEVAILDCFFTAYERAIDITGGASLRILSSDIETTVTGISCTGGSKCQIVGGNFALNVDGSVNLTAAGDDTNVYIEGSLFDCKDTLGDTRGTALQVTTGAKIVAADITIQEAVLGIECGSAGDTDTTFMQASSVNLTNCITDIQQVGSSTMCFVGGVFDLGKLDIADSTNVHITGFTADKTRLAIGKTTDDSEIIYQVLNSQTTECTPKLKYEPNFYGKKGTLYVNPTGAPVFNGVKTKSNNAHYYVITDDRTKESCINLISDTGNCGVDDNVRGWEVSKTGTQANLAFTYSNNDTSGLAERGSNSVMELNGFDNQVEFPTATNAPVPPDNSTAKLVWAGDTNLYRDSASILKTDGGLIVNDLLANRAVATNASKKLVSSATTEVELGYLAGVTSSIQAQIDGKVAKIGDTMTGALRLPAGSTGSPSLNFTGGSTTGLSSNSNNLSFSTAGDERMKISSSGTVSINGLTPAGVVHNDASGNLTSSLIVNADVSPSAAIADTKLATISTTGKVANSATTATSANTENSIVARNASGDFSARTITANLSGSASNNVLKTGDTMTGTLTMPAGAAASPSLQFTGSTNTGISAATANRLSFDTYGAERMSISGSNIISPNITTVAPFIMTNKSANQAIQSENPTSSNVTITANATTSILLLKHTGPRNNVTIVFPPSPIDGQLFTILLGTTARIIIINNGNGASVVNGITRLDPSNPFTTTQNGVSVTYFYSAAANTWYRCGRG